MDQHRGSQGQRREAREPPEMAPGWRTARGSGFPPGDNSRAYCGSGGVKILSCSPRNQGSPPPGFPSGASNLSGPAKRCCRSAPRTPGTWRSSGCNKSWEKSPWRTSSSRKKSSTWRTAALCRGGSPGPRVHDGSIITSRVNDMWGTDMTTAFTTEEGQAAIFFAVDHCSLEYAGICMAHTRHPLRGSVTYQTKGQRLPRGHWAAGSPRLDPAA
jgi:hypothetical protein